MKNNHIPRSPVTLLPYLEKLWDSRKAIKPTMKAAKPKPVTWSASWNCSKEEE